MSDESTQPEESDETSSFSQVNDRLKEIAAQVDNEDLPLDDALSLFEEAVKLGMQASDLLEEDLAARNQSEDEAQEALDAAASDQGDALAEAPAAQQETNE